MAQIKIKQQEEAIKLRLEGKSLIDIALILQVSKSSVSLWIRHLPKPEKFTKEYRAKIREEKRQKLLEARKNIVKPERILSGDGRWMIRVPEGYLGKTYIKGLYIYEHRYIMEQKLGRLLEYNEVVHHIDGNKLNNAEDNLELKTRQLHTKDHSPVAEKVILKCKKCSKEFEIKKRNYKNKIKNGQTKFFCCRSHQVSFQQIERNKVL